MVGALVGCSSPKAPQIEPANSASSSDSIEQQAADQETAAPNEPASSIVSVEGIGDYSDGLAWVRYKEEIAGDKTEWEGFIDETGKLVFKYKGLSGNNPQSFEDGVAYIDHVAGSGSDVSRGCYVVDKTGTILGNFTNVVAYGGGLVITSEYNDGFESTSYDYRIYDSGGRELYSFSNEGNKAYEIEYCGNGVFAFGSWFHALSGNSTFHGEFFYFANTNDVLELEFNGVPKFDGKSDKALLSFEATDDDDDGESEAAHLVLLTDNGKTEDINIGDVGGYIDDARLDGDICTLRIEHYDSRMLAYDLTTGSLRELDSKYSQAIEWSKGTSFGFSDDRCVIKMKGADGDGYVGIFDTSWKPVVEPFKRKGDARFFSDKRLIVGTDVYDVNGQVVFTLQDSIGDGHSYSDGFLTYVTGKRAFCLDVNGDVVFDTIVDTGALTIDKD